MQTSKKRMGWEDAQLVIPKLAAAGMKVPQIAEKLGLDARSVSGFLSMARRHARGATERGRARFSPPPLLKMPTPEEQFKALKEKWKKSVPDAEFSLLVDGQRVYIGAYKGGIVLKVGDQKNEKVALLTTHMALRLNMRFIEMANWSR